MDEPVESSVGALEPFAGLRRALTARDEDQGTHVTDLPAVVLGSILAHLEDLVDVMSALCTCRLFWFLVRTAPFRLRLRHRQFDETPAANCEDAPSTNGRVTPQTAGSWTRAALGSIRTHMCATRELDLSGCFILDDDVTMILTSLRSLDRLILDNCQKLTSATADVLAASVKSGPLSVSLQRCFGLRSSSTGNLLVASAADGSRMRCLLLSHIDTLDISQNDSNVQQTGDHDSCERELTRGDIDLAKSFGSISIGSGLRILALNNCALLAISDFISVGMLCPYLELLFLGGSVQALGHSRIKAVSQDTISSTASTIVRIIELLPRLRVLELTFFASAVVQAVREQHEGKIQIWDFCEESSVTAAAWVLDGLRKVKPGSAGSGKLATLLNFPQNEERWESLTEDVVFGLRAAANCSDVRKRTPLHVAAARGDVLTIAGLLAIGAVAVGMKDSSGSTALFVAAESGYAQACELLVRGGADVLASNRAGETPLYIAALKGYSAALGIMLAHCHERGVNWQDADVYGDGWTPLMAAVVGDRRHVGEMLLEAAGFELGFGFAQTGQHLMALGSTVFPEPNKLNDPDVAVIQPVQSNGELETMSFAAKAKDLNAGSTSQQFRRLLDRQNRYGQTALHIAAQKGSVWFTERLLRAGASLDVPNDYGYRAVDVAKRYKHTVIADILKEWESSQRKEAPVSGGKKSARKARRNKDKATRVATPDDEAPKPTLDCKEADKITVDNHNIDHPGLGEVTGSSSFVPDQQDPADSAQIERMEIFETG